MDSLDFVSQITKNFLLPLSPDGSTETEILSHFASLTTHERLEIIKFRSTLFRKAKALGEKISPELNSNSLIEYATHLVAIDFDLRPSHYKNRKMAEPESFPDFEAAFVKSLQRKSRNSKKKELWLTGTMKETIINLREKQGLSWRNIANTLEHCHGFKISHTHLISIYEEKINDDHI
jgi:hypothetical protein